MLKVGLTGGIGSGKTTVSLIFKTIGIPVFCADDEAKKMYANNEVQQQIIEIFGKQIYVNNEVDKKLLATKIFNDKTLLNKVNNIIHPAVHKHFELWLKTQKSVYIIHEAAILFESGFDKFMDKTITVSAPQDVRIQRVIDRDSSSYEQVIKRMENQWSDEKCNAAADFVIKNYANIPILQQVLDIHEKIINLE